MGRPCGSTAFSLTYSHKRGYNTNLTPQGAVMFLMGLLYYVQCRPNDRYAWGICITRLCAGGALFAFTALAQPKPSTEELKYRDYIILLWL